MVSFSFQKKREQAIAYLAQYCILIPSTHDVDNSTTSLFTPSFSFLHHDNFKHLLDRDCVRIETNVEHELHKTMFMIDPTKHCPVLQMDN
jgi:hypothetical protein